MLNLPDPRVVDFAGVQRNFERIAPSLNSLQSQITAANALISAAQGSIAALQSQANTSTTQLGFTTTNAAPTGAFRIQLAGYRVVSAIGSGTANAGTQSTNPLLATDSFVEVSGSTITYVYLPTPGSLPAGKVYTIRNNRLLKAITVRTNATTALVGHSTLASGATITIVNTGSAWRFLSVTASTKAGL